MPLNESFDLCKFYHGISDICIYYICIFFKLDFSHASADFSEHQMGDFVKLACRDVPDEYVSHFLRLNSTIVCLL